MLRSWSKDRTLNRQREANQVRLAAAMTLAKLERWKRISLWYFDDLQADIVETSEMLVRDFDVVKARDFLWKRVHTTKFKSLNRVLDEEIDNSYTHISAFYPRIRHLFSLTMDRLREAEELMFQNVAGRTERVVLSFKDKQLGYETAMLGNALRECASSIRSQYTTRIDKELAGLLKFLIGIINADDAGLLARRTPPEPSA
jgi:hypothetical protein